MNEQYKGKLLPFQPKTGDIVLRRNDFRLLEPQTYLSTAIRTVDGMPYNHCGVVIQHDDGTLWLYEARMKGVVRNPLFAEGTLNNTSSTCVAFLRAKEGVPPTIANSAKSLLGIKYDIISLVYHQVVYRIPRYLNLRCNLSLKEELWVGSTNEKAKGKLVCSELVGILHNLDKWWLLSTGDIIKTNKFQLLWEERPLLEQAALFTSQ